jgi:hypothetical protein
MSWLFFSRYIGLHHCIEFCKGGLSFSIPKNSEGVPSFSPGLPREAGLPWVKDPKISHPRFPLCGTRAAPENGASASEYRFNGRARLSRRSLGEGGSAFDIGAVRTIRRSKIGVVTNYDITLFPTKILTRWASAT